MIVSSVDFIVCWLLAV